MILRSKTRSRAFFALAVTLLASPAVAADGAAETWFDGDEVMVTLKPTRYRLTEGSSGWRADGGSDRSEQTGSRRIEMEGFTPLAYPGRPALPVRKFVVALPPGMRASSVEVRCMTRSPFPGEVRIEAASPILPIPGMARFEEARRRMSGEWQAEHDAVYSADTPFPESAAWLEATGALRRYSYATIAFCPFVYRPLSGRLEVVDEVRLTIQCERVVDVVSSGQLLQDPLAEETASRLFVNYRQAVDLYPALGQPLAPSTETFDLFIITTPGLAGAVAASDYPAHKTALGFRMRTVLTTDSEIASQPGANLAERIRNFLRAYYVPWSIRYVLLVGDYLAVPMRICYPDPLNHVYNPNDPGLIAGGTPTDSYYADLSDPDLSSWDYDGDGYPGEYGHDRPDFLAEVAVGRIPVNNLARITYTLDKMVAFELDTGAWKRNVLHAGAILFFENQDHGEYPFIDGAACLDSIETGLMGGYNITHFNEQAGVVHSGYPWPALTQAAFSNAWGRGEHAIVNWSGHGLPDGSYRVVWTWDDGDGVPEAANGELQAQRFVGLGDSGLDDDHPSIVFAISCDVGYPEPNAYGNCGIDLLTLPGWGASAGIVSSSRPSAISEDWKPSPGGTEQICFDFNRCLIVEGEKVGDALYDGKFHATTYYGWDLLYEYMNLYNSNLYGDPSMEIEPATSDVIASGTIDLPDLELLPCVPNPFALSTSVRLRMGKAGPARVTVHEVTGRKVAVLLDRWLPAGEHSVVWDGSDGGEALPSGVYLVAVRTGEVRASRRVVLLRP